MTTGYYSLIQYCPDLSRQEAVNVGVVLFCPETNYLDLQLSPSLARVRKLFGKGSCDSTQFRIVQSSIEARLKAARSQFRTVTDLEHFAAIQGNSIQLTPPRRVLVDKPAGELQRLFERLVGSPPRREKVDVGTTLEREFAAPAYGAIIQRKVQVVAPVIRRAVTIPYGYKNGRFNLIRPVRFNADSPSELLQKVGGCALEGDELFHHPSDQFGDLQLIVVGQFSRERAAVVEDIRELFARRNTRLYRLEESARLFEEIRTTAKPLPGAERPAELFPGRSAVEG